MDRIRNFSKIEFKNMKEGVEVKHQIENEIKDSVKQRYDDSVINILSIFKNNKLEYNIYICDYHIEIRDSFNNICDVLKKRNTLYCNMNNIMNEDSEILIYYKDTGDTQLLSFKTTDKDLKMYYDKISITSNQYKYDTIIGYGNRSIDINPNIKLSECNGLDFKSIIESGKFEIDVTYGYLTGGKFFSIKNLETSETYMYFMYGKDYNFRIGKWIMQPKVRTIGYFKPEKYVKEINEGEHVLYLPEKWLSEPINITGVYGDKIIIKNS